MVAGQADWLPYAKAGGPDLLGNRGRDRGVRWAVVLEVAEQVDDLAPITCDDVIPAETDLLEHPE